jgi:glycosyltransferase involved in cell wall biosynthesis
MPLIVFIGPLPPPLGGFSYITSMMHASLVSQGASILLLDRSPAASGLPLRLGRLRTPLAAVRLLARHIAESIKRRPEAAYVALSGGAGQWIDLAFVIVSLMFRQKVFFHHHSFSYLDSHFFAFRTLLKCAPHSKHIVLCGRMRQILSERYLIDAQEITILSNLAFLSVPEDNGPQTRTGINANAVKLGFLSNITKEKGIFLFLETLQLLMKSHPGVFQAVIAGPVDITIEAQFAEEIKNINEITYLGAVYGTEKEHFFSEIDILVFPSIYKNEAEPVTIHEALLRGIPVVATARGCTPSTIDQPYFGRIATDSSSLAVADAIVDLIRSVDHRRTMREAERCRLGAQNVLREVVDEIRAA